MEKGVIVEYRTTPTNFVEEVPGNLHKIPDFDSRSGDHYWIVITSYKVSPENLESGEKAFFDHEALVSVAGPVCYYCEKPYTQLLATRRCKGE